MSFFWNNSLSPSSLFTAQSFYPDRCAGIWSDFPNVCTLSPQNQLTLNTQPLLLPRIVKRTDIPTFSDWQTLVLDARQKIERGDFQKVVLARQTTLTLGSPINPQALLQKLLPFEHRAALFMVQIAPSIAFLGATPEKLFTRQGQTLQTEAVAGTIAEGERWSTKEHSEIDPTTLYLEQKLQPFCKDLHWQDLKERPFGKLRHLSRKLEGTLHSPTSNATLIAALHPTPALGGFPSSPALSYLRSVECFDRGWYGAPIGTVSESDADIAVGIRSMLARGKELHLFAGAGIVLQSCPLKEWEELDRKIAHVLEFFS